MISLVLVFALLSANTNRAQANVIALNAGQNFVTACQCPDTPNTEPALLAVMDALHRAGFRVARQKNPSGRISTDKLALYLEDGWHAFDVVSDHPLRANGLNEVPLPNPVDILEPETPQLPQPPEFDLHDLMKRVDAVEAKINTLATAINRLQTVTETLTIDVTTLKARPVLATCKAALNFGAARIPISCRLE